MNAREARLQASSNWPAIISCLAPQLSNAIEKTGKHVACPVHGGKDGFRLYKDFAETGGAICNTCGAFADGLSLLGWINDWNFRDALKAVDEFLNGKGHKLAQKPSRALSNSLRGTHLVRTPQTYPVRTQQKHQQHAIEHLLAQTLHTSPPMRRYLKVRGLSLLSDNIPAELKAIDSLPYWHNGTQIGSFPVMIGIVKNLAGEVVTLHRTYLTAQGFKANVPAPKKLMAASKPGATSGCAIQLYKPTNKLAITEGIETALAVHLATGLPVWAAISTTLLEKIEIPSSVKEVFIMADKDTSGAGELSATMLAKRLSEKHIVKIVLPEQTIPNGKKSIDWLDIYLQEQAAKGDPSEVSS